MIATPPAHVRSDSTDSIASTASLLDLDVAVPFRLSASDASTLGRVPPTGIVAMQEDNDTMRAMRCEPVWRFDDDGRSVSFTDAVNEEGLEARTEQVDRFVRVLKESGRFADVLDGWTEAPCGIVGEVQVGGEKEGYRARDVVWHMERAAAPLFGAKEIVKMY